MKEQSKFFRCTQLFFACIVSLTIFTGCGNRSSIELYVSVNSDDSEDGTLSMPFDILHGAVNELRTLRKSGNTDHVFTDPAGGDFSFRIGSTAIKLGIEVLDVSKRGMIKVE